MKSSGLFQEVAQENHTGTIDYNPGSPAKLSVRTVHMCMFFLQLFDEAPQETLHRPVLSLVAVLYYYRAHYSAFLYQARRKIWVCVDDSYVHEVDSVSLKHCWHHTFLLIYRVIAAY